MTITVIKTRKVTARACRLTDILDESLQECPENSILVISSKIVALCEGRTAPIEDTDKQALIRDEADLFLPVEVGEHGFHFTITRNTLISTAGIDASNAGGVYVLWPANPQRTANRVRVYLQKRFGVRHVGIIITDSTSLPPMRAGTIGIMLAHGGFAAVDYHEGRPDVFGRIFRHSKSGVGSGLAAAATAVMGEENEQTPLAMITDTPFVTFQDHDPTEEELHNIYYAPEEDLFYPFIGSAAWQTGGGAATRAMSAPEYDEEQPTD